MWPGNAEGIEPNPALHLTPPARFGRIAHPVMAVQVSCSFGVGGAVDGSQVYRPRRDQGWLIVGIAAAVLIVGLSFGLRGRPDDAVGVCCFPPFAAVIALFGVAHLRTRVEVGPDGVSKRPRLAGGFALRWAAVEWWSVVDLCRDDAHDTFSDRAVRFAVGWRRYEVRESEVHRPGFGPFLADMRAWAGSRERAEPGAAPDTAR